MNINIKIYMLESVIKRLVSSAKRNIQLYLGVIVGKSFIYSRKFPFSETVALIIVVIINFSFVMPF
jgi:hypothetical protein